MVTKFPIVIAFDYDNFGYLGCHWAGSLNHQFKYWNGNMNLLLLELTAFYYKNPWSKVGEKKELLGFPYNCFVLKIIKSKQSMLLLYTFSEHEWSKRTIKVLYLEALFRCKATLLPLPLLQSEGLTGKVVPCSTQERPLKITLHMYASNYSPWVDAIYYSWMSISITLAQTAMIHFKSNTLVWLSDISFGKVMRGSQGNTAGR